LYYFSKNLKCTIMARIRSLFIIKGTLGEFNFYVDDGINVARRAGGGFNRKDIKTKPEMVRVRENNGEFGHSSKVKSVFMRALRPYFVGIRGRGIHNEMVSMFTQVKNQDVISKRGERHVEAGLASTEGLGVLSSYAYPKAYSLYGVLGCAFTIDWTQLQCTFPDFNPEVTVFPKSATHVGLQFGVVFMDFVQLEGQLFAAEEYFIPREASPQSLTLALPSPVDGKGRRVAILGVRFYQEVNGGYHLLEAGRGTAVVGVN
jgi:hypothetical protein